MAKVTKSKGKTAPKLSAHEQERESIRRALKKAERREKDIRRLVSAVGRAAVAANAGLMRLVRGIAVDNGFDLVKVQPAPGDEL